MPNFKSVRTLDVVIVGLAVVVITLAGYLGYSVWAQNRAVASSTSVSRAVSQVEAAVRKNPNDLDARMQLAQALAVAGRAGDAIEQYEAALTIRKDFTPALAGIGFLALQDKDWARGERFFRKVIEIREPQQTSGPDTQLESAYFYLGTALTEQKEYEDAANYLKRAILLRRDASDSHYALAYAYNKMGLDSKYRQELENTLLFDPKMPEANYDYGLLLLKDGDKGGAAEHFRTSIAAAPGAELPQTALDELGPFSERLAAAKKLRVSDAKAALAEARIAAALDPRNVEALLLAGDLQASAGNEDKAAEAYKAILAIQPGNVRANTGLKKVTNGK